MVLARGEELALPHRCDGMDLGLYLETSYNCTGFLCLPVCLSACVSVLVVRVEALVPPVALSPCRRRRRRRRRET